MAPTKVLKNGHGIHLSSPPASIGMDLDGTVMQNLQLESQMKSTEDGEPLSTIAKSVSPPYSHWEAGLSCFPLASVQPCADSLNSEQPLSRAVLEEAVKEKLSKQAGLQSRALRLQRRFETQLGEHAVLHCNHQLEGLNRLCQTGDLSLDSLESIYSGMLPLQADTNHNLSFLDSSTAASTITALREFSLSSQAVLQHLQEALDSEATASSSSDEEPAKERIQRQAKTSAISRSSCEGKWLEERAELGSRCSWLQLRLADLEERIQQMVEIHKHIRSTKGGVVLAESQVLTDRRIRQSPVQEMAGLSFTAADADNEPCSPLRLLHNIERQSAQLSQMVNSLMPPLNFSPPSKQPQMWKGKRSFTSGPTGDKVFIPKRRRFGVLRQRRFKADKTCMCARTRPLVTYHKPKLFVFNTCCPHSSQNTGTSSSTLSSLSSSSCDPMVYCSDLDCSSSKALPTKTSSSRSHPSLTHLPDSHVSHHPQKALAREEWFLKPLVINAQPSTPAQFNRCSSTPMNSQKHKQRARHHISRVLGLSPIKLSGAAPPRRTNQRKRKRRPRLKDGQADVLYHLCDPAESSDEVPGESDTKVTHKHPSQGFVCKCPGEYEINSAVIPVSLGKVEKLQYKNILTPSWREVDIQTQIKEETEEGQVEDVTDEVFAQRHLALERKEKLLRSSWGERKYCRHATSRLSSSGGGTCTSGEESSLEWSCAQLDTDEQPSSEEWLPQTPWEPRMFPLVKDEEALLSYNLVLHCPLLDKA